MFVCEKMVLTVFQMLPGVYHFLVADFVLVVTFPFEGMCMFYAWWFRVSGLTLQFVTAAYI